MARKQSAGRPRHRARRPLSFDPSTTTNGSQDTVEATHPQYGPARSQAIALITEEVVGLLDHRQDPRELVFWLIAEATSLWAIRFGAESAAEINYRLADHFAGEMLG